MLRVDIDVSIFVFVVVPFVERIVDVGLKISHSAAIGTHELRPGSVVVKHGANALVVPDMGTRRNEEGLAGL